MNKSGLNSNKLYDCSYRANLRLLIWLRGFAIAGQLTAILMAVYFLKIPLPVGKLIIWIGIYTLITCATIFLLSNSREISLWEFFIHLLVDIFILTVLLAYSEGGANPFVSLYLIPLTISAITLPAIFTWIIVAITFSCYSLLVWVITPMSEHTFHAHNFNIHVLGMWLGFAVSAMLVAFFVVRMGRIIQRQQKELIEKRAEAYKDEQLIKLGALAASTAHELGTPLGAMQLISENISDEDDKNSRRSQLQDLQIQIKRCKEALSTLSASVGSAPLENGEPMRIEEFIQDIIQNWQQTRPNVNLKTYIQNDITGPKILSEKSLQQAIKNILDNAADASPTYVSCETIFNTDELQLVVSDKGPGLTMNDSSKAGQQPFSDSKGLGLGLFLSYGIIRRFGGSVVLKNRSEGGLQTTISLPINALAVS